MKFADCNWVLILAGPNVLMTKADVYYCLFSNPGKLIATY